MTHLQQSLFVLLLTLALGHLLKADAQLTAGPRQANARVSPGPRESECSSASGHCLPSRSLCPTNAAVNSSMERLVVVAGSHHSALWLRDLGLPYIVYQHEDEAGEHFFSNLAREAAAYLQFIYDYYDCLPKAVVFLHGHRLSWHSCNMAETLRGLHWDLVPGYADLNRKIGIWTRPLKALRSYPDGGPIATGKDAYNGSFVRGQVIGGNAFRRWEAYLWHQRMAAREIYDDFLGPEGLGAMPDYVSYYCCPQMVVHPDRIQHRSRDFYRRFLLYLADNTIRGNHQNAKDFTLADGVNYFWAMVFGFSLHEAASDGDLFDTERC